MRSRPVVLLLLLVVSLAACSDDSSGSTATTTGGTSGATTSTTEGGAVGATTTAAVTTSAPEQVGDPLIAGLPVVVQVTPLTGGGPRPLLEWQPIDGAARYDVTLYTPDGLGYWAWHGPETSVVVGELATPGQSGPRVSPGMTWAVLALDADGIPIASSAVRPIEP